MRRIKKSEHEHGMKWCSYCKPLKVGAKWRNMYLRCDIKEEKLMFACDGHKHLLIDGTAKPFVRNEQEDDHLTEADYQTWCNL